MVHEQLHQLRDDKFANREVRVHQIAPARHLLFVLPLLGFVQDAQVLADRPAARRLAGCLASEQGLEVADKPAERLLRFCDQGQQACQPGLHDREAAPEDRRTRAAPGREDTLGKRGQAIGAIRS